MPEANKKSYEIFKNTREERGLSLSEVANSLHLTVTMIEQIEAGEFTHRHLAPVFMRGYIRLYAKYLNLPEKIVDEMLNPLIVENPVKVAEESKHVYMKQNKKPPRVLNSKKILSYLLVVALLIIIASFWHGFNKSDAIESQPVTSIEQTENTASESVTEDQNAVSSGSEEDPALQVEDEPSLPPEESTPDAVSALPATETPLASPVIETPPTVPVAEIPPPSTPVIVSPPRVKKAPAHAPVVPSQPEVVDAEETP